MTHILLIEDSPTQALQIQMLLEQLGIDVSIMHDGPEGLQFAVDEQPDLIILDVEMPSMNGFQVCHRLRRNPETSAIPIIMLTNLTHPKAISQGAKSGADDYIPKDIFAAEHLLNTMRNLKILEATS